MESNTPAELTSPLPDARSLRRSKVRLLTFLPSLTDLLFIVLLFMGAYGSLAQRLFEDGSVGWHIRAGQRIVRTASLPETDPFSSAGEGHKWYVWEWLFDIAAGAVDSWRGLNGVALLAAVILATTFALAFRFTLLRGGEVLWSVFLFLLALGASMVHFLARPHIVSWLFAILFFQVLDSAERVPETRRNLIWLPLIMAIWVNVHGGFLLGIALWGIYLVSTGLHYIFANRIERFVQARWIFVLAFVGVLTLLASLINPYGYKLHRHVIGYLSNSFFMTHIDEFRAPDFHGAAQQCFVLLLLIAVCALSARPRRLTFSQLLVVLFAIYSGLYATRNLPVASLLLMMIIGPLLPKPPGRWLPKFRGFDEGMTRLEREPRVHMWPVIGVVAAVIVCARPGLAPPVRFSESRFPENAVGYLLFRGVQEPVFVPDSWGGYLIYRAYPQMKVVFDDRHDLYGQAGVEKYLGIIGAQPGWDESSSLLHVNWMVLPSQSPLVSAASLSEDWRQVYGDNVAAVFERENN